MCAIAHSRNGDEAEKEGEYACSAVLFMKRQGEEEKEGKKEGRGVYSFGVLRVGASDGKREAEGCTALECCE